jgi:hypothetical protein
VQGKLVGFLKGLSTLINAFQKYFSTPILMEFEVN